MPLTKKTFKIPIEIVELQSESFHLFIYVKISRNKLRFLIDTGASKSVIDQEFLKQKDLDRGINTLDTPTASLHGTVNESMAIVLPQINLGGLILKNELFAVIDLEHVNSTYQQVKAKPIHGIIGSDLLVKYNAVIDYPKALLGLKV